MSIIVAVQDKIMECPKFQKSPNVRNNAFSYVNLPFYQFLPLENHLKMVEECLLDNLCVQSYKKIRNTIIFYKKHRFALFLRYIAENAMQNCYIEQEKGTHTLDSLIVFKTKITTCCMFCQVLQLHWMFL